MKVASPRTSVDSPTVTSQPIERSSESTRLHRFTALQSRNFKLLWLGLLISNSGTWMESTGQGWLITDLEPARKAFWLGIIAAAFAVPMLVLTPIGGAVADRVPKLRLLWTVQISYLLFSGILAALTLSDLVNVWYLIIYSFINGIVLAFDSPGRHAILPDLVSRDQLTSAVSLNSAAFTGASLIGPAIAGGLIPLIGVGGVFVVNTLSCVATLWALWQMKGLPQRSKQGTPSVGAFESIRRGVAYVWKDPLVRGLLTVSLVSGLFSRSYGPLIAVFARDEFHVGSVAFGFLLAAGGLGTLIGAFGLAGRGNVRHRGRWLFGAITLQALFTLLFAISPWFLMALPMLTFVGVANAVAAALTATSIQLAAPQELRGRIMSLYIITLIAVPSVGALVAGSIGDLVGVREAVAGGAVVVILAVSYLFTRIPSLRQAA